MEPKISYLTFEIFGLAANHGKQFSKLSQSSFSEMVHERVHTVWALLRASGKLLLSAEKKKLGGRQKTIYHCF